MLPFNGHQIISILIKELKDNLEQIKLNKYTCTCKCTPPKLPTNLLLTTMSFEVMIIENIDEDYCQK